MIERLERFLSDNAKLDATRKVEARALADLEGTLTREIPEPLRSVYLEVGTGWGPEHGLLSLAESLQLWTQWTGEKPEAFAAWQWPAHVFPILDWGCQIYSCVDLADGRILRFRGDHFIPDDPDGGGADPTQAATFDALLLSEAGSLDAWAQSWMDGTLKF